VFILAVITAYRASHPATGFISQGGEVEYLTGPSVGGAGRCLDYHAVPKTISAPQSTHSCEPESSVGLHMQASHSVQ
jgi:hypothetical protein